MEGNAPAFDVEYSNLFYMLVTQRNQMANGHFSVRRRTHDRYQFFELKFFYLVFLTATEMKSNSVPVILEVPFSTSEKHVICKTVKLSKDDMCGDHGLDIPAAGWGW